MKRFLFIPIIVLIISCEDEPFSPKSITTTETEGWPLQRIDLIFDSDNLRNVNFRVRLGTRELKSEPRSNGLAVTLPSLAIEEVGPLIVETPGGRITVVENFKVKPKPKVVYASPLTFSHRIPLKLVLSDWSYIKSPISDNSNFEFKVSNFWSTGYAVFNGDTLVVRNPGILSPENPYQFRLNIYNLSYNPDINTEAEVVELQNIIFGSFNYKPSFQKLSASGRAGDRLEIIFNDTNYFPDQLTVKLSSTIGAEGTLIFKGFDFVSAPGYINAMFGSYEIPQLPAGNYEITVIDSDGLTYLSEGVNTFTIIQ